MTPSLPTILMGQVAALSAPAPPEASGDYAVSRGGMVAMLLMLSAQEAERGPAARVWENGALRSLLADAAGDYDEVLGGALSSAAGVTDGDGGWSVLDAANADLRRRLIALHEAAESRRDEGVQRRILDLYVEMAKARHLDLPGAAGG
ncbi:MAG: hypothetical protein JO111_08380 [Caulobacteraceae bacterium]|nr:hypothetical protein [Caulobacteraceae bacterium]